MVFFAIPVGAWLLLAAMIRLVPPAKGDPQFTYGDAVLYLGACAVVLAGVTAFAYWAGA